MQREYFNLDFDHGEQKRKEKDQQKIAKWSTVWGDLLQKKSVPENTNNNEEEEEEAKALMARKYIEIRINNKENKPGITPMASMASWPVSFSILAKRQ